MKKSILVLISFTFALFTFAQTLPALWEKDSTVVYDSCVRAYIMPKRIVWHNDSTETSIKGSEFLLSKSIKDISIPNQKSCHLISKAGKSPAILLDFGKELQGGILLTRDGAGSKDPIKVRIRFGESVSEAMSDITPESGATNDHAMRDFTLEIPWVGSVEAGNSGFRFVRIDLIDPDKDLGLKDVKAIFTYRDIPYKGSFRCNDNRLNQIWDVGAYTVHLNMQDYLWDGIKRDRLVWMGDMHPEMRTINAVFGYNEVVPKSLDYSRKTKPLPKWMNGIGTYSVWWLIVQNDWYKQHGDLVYLRQQQEYIKGLIKLLDSKIQTDGSIKYESFDFLDWPSSPNQEGVKAGVHTLAIMAMQAGTDIADALNDKELKQACADAEKRLRAYSPNYNNSKQAAALMVLAGLHDAAEINKNVISVGGAKDFSTFYGYYMLEAMAMAGDYENAMSIIRTYWGAMLDLGATTFWEDFNMDWVPKASRIDELVPEGKKDIHADYGGYCYKGLRHSLCHGWASGPTAWLSRYVLGVNVEEAGCKVISITPHLGNLQWAEGTYPTPLGKVWVRHDMQADGTVKTKYKLLKGVKLKN